MAFTQGRAKIRGKAHQNLAEADRLEAGGSDPKNWKVDIPVPDFSTLSRRGLGLRLPAKPRVDRTEPIHLTMDSTGLKIFGEGEWLQVKHETKAKRKSWRKLHLGLDLMHIPGYPPTYSDNIRPFVPGYPPSFDALP